MNDRQQKEAAKEFVKEWTGKGYEKGQSHSFWLSLLGNVYGVDHPEKFIEFEKEVHLDSTSFIDAMIPETKVMIEQKGLGKDLKKPIKQSDGSLLTPFQQAKRYANSLPYSEIPRYIVTCNFSTFLVYDMENPNGEPEEIKLEDLPNEYYRLNFLVDTGDKHIQKELEVSVKAGELVGKLYDALRGKYKDPDNEDTLKSLNILCVRLVFCLYAEDAGLFKNHSQFHDYLAGFNSANARIALMELFRILDTKEEDRDPEDDDRLLEFPYVNGGLFSNKGLKDEHVRIPQLDDEIVDLILTDCSAQFDWSHISPTIFGAVFESTLNPETRRSGGMHYTSIENIHKVIDPLFLNDLKHELKEIEELKSATSRNRRLKAFQDKLASLTFLDPACGSGNFLTETYLSLRRLENRVISDLNKGMIVLGDIENPIKVSISQFYGIEVNDFAVTVAKTALWIAESQMIQETESIVNMDIEFFPLKTNAYIHEGNALRIDWNDIIPSYKLSYIMGNPPFVGGMYMKPSQKSDLTSVCVDKNGIPFSKVGKLDYVSGWYVKTSQFIESTSIRVAFVSTNSITQGEQVACLWKPLFEQYNVQIDFAYQTFVWENESSSIARVHCVIIGFSSHESVKEKRIYINNTYKVVTNINAYLMGAPTVFVESRNTTLCKIPQIHFGSMPRDGGWFILDENQKNDLISKTPNARKWVHLYLGSREFLNNLQRWCLWLVNADPQELRKCPFVLDRIEKVKNFRLGSKAEGTRKFAKTPTLFCQIAQPDTNYIAIPKVSSEKRRYIPMGFLPPDVIASDLLFVVPYTNLYHFGVLESNVHMAWMRTVAGRLKSDYRYSKDVVYNNFPWPTPTDSQKERIEKTAQAILNARKLYSNASLADLYDETIMPSELRKAHQENDKVVMEAYGFDWHHMTESDCVAELMKLYQKLVEEQDDKE